MAALAACTWLTSCKEEKKEDPPPPPSLLSIAPDRGLMAGGTAFTLTGENLQGASSVTLGMVEAQVGTISEDGTQLEAVSALTDTRATADVTVVTPGGVAMLPMAWRYLSPVAVSQVDPNSVETVGTTTVVLRGSGLFPPVMVAVSGPSTATFTAGLGTEFAVPVEVSGLASGLYDLTVTNGDDQMVELTGALTVETSDPPALSGMTPARGLERGGNQVRLSGVRFTSASAVTVGGANVPTFTVNSNGTEIVFNVPAGTRGPATATVTTPAGTGSLMAAYIYTRAVVLTDVSPPQVVTGVATPITINGSGMVSPVRVFVARNNMPQEITIQSAMETAVTATLPVVVAGDYAVTVVNGDGESGTLQAPLRVRAALALTGIHPNAGFTDVNTPVEITGPDLTGVTAVLLDNAPCTNLVLATSQRLTCVAQAAPAGPVDVAVQRGTEAEGVLVNGFTYISPTAGGVRLLAVEPGGGRSSGGQTVELLATGLAPGATVTFGTTAATVGTLNGNRLPVTTPARTLPAGQNSLRVDVTLSVGASSDTLVAGFRYHRQPVFTSATPNKGATVGGDLITINGQGFTDEGTVVLFDGQACTDVVVLSSTQLTCRIPRHVLGFATVVIQSEYDDSSPVPNAFEFVDAVRIVSVDPPHFSIAGGTIVEATGSGFATGQMQITVVEDGVVLSPANVTVLSPTLLRFTLPARLTGGTVTLRVEDAGRLGQPFSSGEFAAPYVDPTDAEGGRTGGPINRNIFVTVLREDNGQRVSGAAVFTGSSWGSSPLRGTTNSNGMLVLARVPQAGPVMLTAAATNHAAATLVGFNAREVTIRLPRSQPPTTPGTMMASVSGVLLGWEYAGYPTGADPNRFKRVAVVWPSEPEPGTVPAATGGQNIISETPCDISRDGVNNPLTNQYTLQVTQGRTLALMATVYFYDSVDGTCDPQMDMGEGLLALPAAAMALAGPIAVQSGTNPGINLQMNFPASTDFTVGFNGAPSGANIAYTVNAIFDLAEMGSLSFFGGFSQQPTLGMGGASPTLGYYYLPPVVSVLASSPTGLPVTGGIPTYNYHGITGRASLNGTQVVGYRAPISEVYQRDFVSNTALLTGWFNLPAQQAPTANGLLSNRHFQWADLGRGDGLVLLDVARPGTGGDSPVWNVVMPGGTTSVDLPTLAGIPSGADLASGTGYAWRVQALSFQGDVPFGYNEHHEEPLGHLRAWRAHAVSEQLVFFP